MLRQLEAVYEHGVLRPLEPVNLRDRQRILLTLDEQTPPPRTWPSPEPVNQRQAELQWLRDKSEPYAGKWVALHGDRLIAHGDDLAVVRAAAMAAGIDRPLLTHVPPADDLPFAGW